MSQSHFPTLIEALQNPLLYDHVIQNFQILETHISWVLLTGPYAYKIKKPVNLGFLDFSTIEHRRFFCEEELRLNQRLAPEFYLELVTITGRPETPCLNGSGEPIEYAVKMKQFPQEALLSQRIQKIQISSSHIDELAKEIAKFHAHIAVADSSSRFGTPELIRNTVMDNFEHLPSEISRLLSVQEVERLKHWAKGEHSRHIDDFNQRKEMGFVRECHGDLHLGNMALVDNQIVIFDCIEFNDQFRWIDVMSEVAFAVMDLIDRGAPRFGWRLLNVYLEQTGDYEGLTILRFYLTYRAMVRAKVTGIRLAQKRSKNTESLDLASELKKYLALAASFTQSSHPVLLIMHGLSGSGKTTVSQTLLESLGTIRIRSDIERKRLLEISQTTRTEPQQTSFVYSENSTQATYSQLAILARSILQAGFSVIVDATFLKQQYREVFSKLAKELNFPFYILDIRAPETLLRQRVASRLQEGKDASEADISVLEQQLSEDDPFSPSEQSHVLEIETEHPNDLGNVVTVIQKRMNTASPQ